MTWRFGMYSPTRIADFNLASSPMIEVRNLRRLASPGAVFLFYYKKKQGELNVRPAPEFRMFQGLALSCFRNLGCEVFLLDFDAFADFQTNVTVDGYACFFRSRFHS